MKLLDIIKEIEPTIHFNDRQDNRIFSDNLITVLEITYPDKRKKITKIGKFNFPDKVVSSINQETKHLFDKSFNVDPNLYFATITYKFKLFEIWKNTTLIDKINNKIDRTKLINMIQRVTHKDHHVNLLIYDHKTNSIGNNILWIIKDNKFITSMFITGHTKDQIKFKLSKSSYNNNNNNNDIIVLNSPQEIEYYYTDDEHDFSALK